MTITAQWDNDEKTVIRFIFEDPVDWPSLHEVIDEVAHMQTAVDHQVVWIYDTRQVSRIPHGGLRTAKNVAQRLPANTHHTQIAIGANAMIRFVANTFLRFYGKHYQLNAEFAASLEEAHARAQELLAEAQADSE